MSILRRALYFSFAGKYTILLIELVSVMVISRIFTPADLGIYSLAAASIVIGQMLRDFGLSLYIVQEKNLTDEKIQSCFTISLILCWLIALSYYLLAPFIGEFIGNESVAVLVKILAINFLVIPFGTFTLAVYKREMKFDKLMVIDIASTLVRITLLLSLAFAGFGVISMAYASVVGTLTTIAMTLPAKNWSHHKIRFAEWRDIAKFSSFVSASNIISELKATIPEMMIGRYLSVESVAYFAKANATLGLFSKLITSAVTPVIQPHFSKIRREEGNASEAVYQVQNYTLAMQWPFCIFIFVFAQGVIALLYGPQWGQTVPLTSVLAILLFIDGFTVFGEQLLNAVGRVRFIFRLSLLILFMRVVLVYLLVSFGLEYIVISFLAITLVRTAILFPKIYQEFALDYMRLLQVYGLNLKICLPLLVLAFGADYVITQVGYSDWYVLLIGALYTLTWIFLVMYLKHPIHQQINTVLQKFKLAKA